MSDMESTIAPKSDQLNADDLLGGKTMTITITRAKVMAGDEQPCVLWYKDGNAETKKPYKPCKSMRRVLVQIWGRDSQQYVGRSMTLYCDKAVKFGGMEVGGIRISHMSGIDSPVTMALTASKANRKPFTVKPLVVEKPVEEKPEHVLKAEGIIRNMRACETAQELDLMLSEDASIISELEAVKNANQATYDFIVSKSREIRATLKGGQE